MSHNSTLSAVRDCSVEIKDNITDQEIVKVITGHFSQAKLEVLALQLQQAALLFGFAWQSASWEFSNAAIGKPLIIMRYEAETAHGNILLERLILFDGNKMIAKHSYFEIPEPLQENGFSRFINRILYKFYKTTGVRGIKLYASLDIGGYVWAVAGFAAISEAQVQKIINTAWARTGPQSSIVPATLILLDNHLHMHFALGQGKPYPIYHWIVLAGKAQAKEILLDSNWHGELNFDDNVQMASFGNYINKDESLIKPW